MTQLPVPTDLTPKMAGFAEEYVVLGGRNGTLAAKRAGYSDTSAESTASRLLRDPRILREIRRITETALQAGVVASAKTLEQIRDDKDAPIAERRKAASELLDRGGMILARVHELHVQVVEPVETQIARIVQLCEAQGVDPKLLLGGAVEFFGPKRLARAAAKRQAVDAEFEPVAEDGVDAEVATVDPGADAAPTVDGIADLI